MKIAIVGAMGVGKTTLAHQIREVTGFEVLPEVARMMAEEGHPLDNKITAEVEHEILFRQVKLERASEFEDVIADRCLIDLYAYALILFNHDWELLNRIHVELMRAKYDYIFFMEPEFPIEDDGVRSTDVEFQKRINDKIKFILTMGEFKWHQISGSREERIKRVLTILGR